MSGELRKPHTLMRPRHWLSKLIANVSAGWSNGSRNLQEGSTIMDVIIQKINGLWHLIVGSCQIRTPFLETQDRALAIAYARRVYPGAKILERD